MTESNTAYGGHGRVESLMNAEGDLSRARVNLMKQDTLHQLALGLKISEVLRLDAGDELVALRASHGQAPAGATEREFNQFLSDVMTAAGLVTHGNKCKALGERLAEMCVRLRCPTAQAAPAAGAVAGPSLIMQVGTQGFDLASTSAHFTTGDMYTASAQAFREGQAAATTPAAQADRKE